MNKFMHFFAMVLLGISQSAAAATGCTTNPTNQPNSTFPSLNGRLLYHSYVTYGDGSSHLFMLDFSTGKLTQLSNANWHISDPMNAVFSPVDGNWVTFTRLSP